MSDQKTLEEKIEELEDELEVSNDEKRDLEIQLCEKQNEISDLNERIDFLEGRCNIRTGRDGGINWSADNLLDQQIMESFSDLIGSVDSVRLLQFLQNEAKFHFKY